MRLTAGRRLGTWAAVVLLAVFTTGAASGRPSGHSPATKRVCDRAAGPRGNDAASGTVQHPFASVPRLTAALRPGQTGCLFQGQFNGDVTISHGGTPTAPIVLRAAPGASATISGEVDFERGGNYWRLTRLNINGASSGQRTVQIHANGLRLDHDNITNQNFGESCIIDGSVQYGVSRGTVIDHNVIHNCGASKTAQFNHGVYVCCGYGTKVTNNVIYGNSGFGVQLYPNADKALVANNIIDRNAHGGGIVGGDLYGACYATDRATVANNIITNNGRYGIDAWWGCTRGTSNRAIHNCLWSNAYAAFNPEGTGFTASGNIKANPRFVRPSQHDYRLRRQSPCAGLGPRGQVGP
jgi:Right handed beta helix region